MAAICFKWDFWPLSSNALFDAPFSARMDKVVLIRGIGCGTNFVIPKRIVPSGTKEEQTNAIVAYLKTLGQLNNCGKHSLTVSFLEAWPDAEGRFALKRSDLLINAFR